MLKINRRQLIGGAGMALAAPAIIGTTSASADDMYGEPKPNVGTIKYLPNFNSKHVAPRDVAIWTPDPDTFDGPLPVIYAGDGEGLFDPDVSKYGSSWNLDLILNMMAIQGYGPAIVVANAAVHKDRSREYNSPTIAKYFENQGVAWNDVSAKEVLGSAYSGAAGYQQILSQVEPVQGQRGGSCGV